MCYKIKFIRANLIKEVKDLYSEICEILVKKKKNW